ncbi:MAG: Gfo/Idh/MocA family oxidoreductase [Propionibacteriaceae bacterium]|nr:Gfo/Idh/MocA family oxidoreductase [Propionibacteriaceae bacterium]
MLRVGFLGAAHLHADAYVQNLRTAGAQVVGVYDWVPIRALWWGQKFGVAPFDELEALLTDCDAVVVCSETAFHADLVEQAASAGCAVLCEKPLGTNYADSAQIVSACERAGVVLMTAFPMRFHPGFQQLHTMVTGGQLGRLLACIGTNQSVMPMQERAWFANSRLSGGGAIMDHVVHLADLYGWLLQAEPQQVYASANQIVHAGVVDVETSGLVLLDYAEGVYASIDCSWNRPLDYPSWGGIGLSVVGERGSIEVDAMSQRLTRFGGSGPFGWLDWGTDVNQLMVEEFLAAAREGRQPLVTGQDGLRATAIALAARESAATGNSVAMSVHPS